MPNTCNCGELTLETPLVCLISEVTRHISEARIAKYRTYACEPCLRSLDHFCDLHGPKAINIYGEEQKIVEDFTEVIRSATSFCPKCALLSLDKVHSDVLDSHRNTISRCLGPHGTHVLLKWYRGVISKEVSYAKKIVFRAACLSQVIEESLEQSVFRLAEDELYFSGNC